MSKTTPATLALRKLGCAFKLHTYVYDSSAESTGLQAAEALGVDPNRVLKTLMAEVDGTPVCVVVPADCEVSMKKLAAVALMFLPGIGIMTWKDAQPRIPWGTVVLFGIGISVGTALLQTKGASWLADLAVAQFGLKYASALFILGVLSLFLTLIHLGFASATALASAMIPIVIAVLQGVATPGINIVGMTMLLQFVVSFGFILVVNAPQNMVAYGTETFEARDFVRTGLVLTVIALALVMLLGATYWRWLGYV